MSQKNKMIFKKVISYKNNSFSSKIINNNENINFNNNKQFINNKLNNIKNS